MKTAEYKLPFGVVAELEPVETGRTEAVKDKDGKVILGPDGKPGKPVYTYRTVNTREAETLAEFGANMVEADKPEEHTLSLAQAQWDIIAQRKVREFAAGQDVRDMLDGKHADTKDLTEDERVEYVMAAAQEIADNYRYGSRPASTGGTNAAAKAALTKQKALDAAAQANPEVAAKLAELQATLAKLGITA